MDEGDGKRSCIENVSFKLCCLIQLIYLCTFMMKPISKLGD